MCESAKSERAAMGLIEVLEEIEVLQSIFCRNGEFTLHSDIKGIKHDSACSITYSITIEVNEEHLLPSLGQASECSENIHGILENVIVLTVTVNDKYPSELQGISLKSTGLFTRNMRELKYALDKHVKENLLNEDEEPFMLRIVEWIKENSKTSYFQRKNFSQYGEEKEEPMLKCVVFTLNHMRSKQKYTKLITGWMEELNLVGRVIFFQKAIWVLIHGRNDNVREYMKRHKTCNVDVNSNGQPCKERMMNIVVDVDSTVSLEM